MKTRKQLKSEAKSNLKNYWESAIFVTCISTSIISMYLRNRILALIISGSFLVGICMFYLSMSRKNDKEVKFSTIFNGFHTFWKSTGLFFLYMLIVLVGLLLFIIPGIIIALLYSQSFFILADNPTKSIPQCLSESAEMMKCHKFDLFVLNLSFIGWFILSIFTVGLGLFYLIPYRYATLANYFYEISGYNKFHKNNDSTLFYNKVNKTTKKNNDLSKTNSDKYDDDSKSSNSIDINITSINNVNNIDRIDNIDIDSIDIDTTVSTDSYNFDVSTDVTENDDNDYY